MFRGLDHIAIAVADTEAALRIWRDRFGFPVLFTQVVNQGRVRLTHLDLGNTHLQLAQPLVEDHRLWDWLQTHGEGLHHLCLAVDDLDAAVDEAASRGLPPGEPRPHEGTGSKRALYLRQSTTGNVAVELTG